MMRSRSQRTARVMVGAVLLSLVVSACGGADTEDTSSGLATLTDETSVTETTAERTDEEALLEFADCMRENGVPDFQDPILNADGSIEFTPPAGAGGGDGEGPSQELQDAFEACFGLLEGITLGPGGGNFDFTELQDDLLLLAQCLRDNGLPADDPNISEGFGGNRGEGPGQGLASLFGPNVDLTDEKVRAVIEECAAELDLAGPGAGGGPGAGPGFGGNGG